MSRTLVLAAIVAAAPAGAGAQPAIQLTLDDAIVRGMATSHRLAQAVAQGEAAASAAVGWHAMMLPQLAALGGYMRTNHVDPFGILMPDHQLKIIYPDVPDNYRARLDLQWPIYTAGRLDALERAAQAEASAVTADVRTARADLRLEITRAYWALVTATESLRVVQESVARVAGHLRDVRNQFAAGLVPPNEVSSAEALESRQRMLTIQARTMRDVAEAELGHLVDAPLGTAIQATSPLAAPGPVEMPESALIELAIAARGDRAALVQRVTAAEARRHAAAAGRQPTVAVAAGIDYARPNPRIFPLQRAWHQSWDVSINGTWSIFDGGRTSAAIGEATANRRAAEERLAEFDSILSVEIRQRLGELESSRAAIAAAGDAVTAAGEAHRVVSDRYIAGVSTSSDVLDAQVALLQAGLDQTQTMASARLAEARLNRAVGREP